MGLIISSAYLKIYQQTIQSKVLYDPKLLKLLEKQNEYINEMADNYINEDFEEQYDSQNFLYGNSDSIEFNKIVSSAHSFTTNRISQQYIDYPILDFKPKFTVLSYNVLASYLATQENFPYVKQKYLEFNYRNQVLIRQIVQLGADIICLQEVDQYYNFYKDELRNCKLNYNTIFLPRKKIPNQGFFFQPHGVLTGWNPKKFQFIKKWVITPQDAINDKEFINSNEAQYYKQGVRALVVELKELSTEQTIIIVNLHLFENPKFENVKIFEITQILLQINATYTSKNDKIILAGVFNSLPDSNSIKIVMQPNMKNFGNNFVKNEFLDEEKLQKIENIYQQYYYQNKQIANGKVIRFESAYKFYYQSEVCKLNQKASPPLFTNYTKNFKGTLDHIFYTCKRGMKINNILKIPEDLIQKLYEGLPSKLQPSDHLPILAEFILQKGKKNIFL